MKTSRLIKWVVALLMLVSVTAPAQLVQLHWISPVKERYVTLYAEPQGKPPDEMACLVSPDNPDPQFKAVWEQAARTNRNLIAKSQRPSMDSNESFDDIFNTPFDKAVWVPFQTNFPVDFGPGDGARWLHVGFRMKGDGLPQRIGNRTVVNGLGGKWDAHHITLQTVGLTIGITDPKERVTSQPMIQLHGFTSADLEKPLAYKIFNQSGATTASGEGLVNDRYHDKALWDFTTNYFTCCDLDLSPGTNTIVLQGEDRAGFSFTTNFVIVFTTVGDTNPPVFSIASPAPGTVVAATETTIRGPVDDPTAKMEAQVSANGQTRSLSALVERNGYFWFEHVPLIKGTNQITFVATDAAGNSSRTNFVIYGSDDVRVFMNPVEPAGQLWQPSIKVITGTVQPASWSVWINGVQATVKPDGTWQAGDVPVLSSPSGGTALFNMSAVPPGELAKNGDKIKDLVSTQASLGTNALVLNAASPACGVFTLHLTETAGRGFVLEASTNLMAWSPILTNATPNPTFDYTDTNASDFHCRFFRVVPLP